MSEPIERIVSQGITSPLANFLGRSDATRREGKGFEQGLSKESASGKNGGIQDSLSLSPEAQEQLRKLRQRDAEVRAHEAAHLAAAGQYAAGGAHYEYQKGPDGRMYAIGGHVSIDTSSVPGDAEASEQKAEQVRRAALAPGNPSAQDSKVAAKAAQMAAEARQDQAQETREETGPQKADASDSIAGVFAGAEALRQQHSGRVAVETYAAVQGFFADAEDGVGPHGRAYRTMAYDPMMQQQARQEQNGFFSFSMSKIARALQSYSVAATQGIPVTALAPSGTGLSLQI